jgi:crotonobetaine/carnitine-CoA ligase
MTNWRGPARLTIPGLLRQQAEAIGDKVFVHFEDTSVSYGEMEARSTTAANALAELGVGPGDTVCVLMRNYAEMLYTWFGAAKLGAIYAPVNTAYLGEYLKHQLRTAGARVVVTEADLAAEVTRVAGDVGGLAHLLVRGEVDLAPTPGLTIHSTELLLAHDQGRLHSSHRASWTDPNAIIFTAGTTGPSKGVVMTQNYLVRSAEQMWQLRDGRPDDVGYSPLPLFHLNAMILTVLGPMTTGASGALDQRFSASRYWDRVRHYGGTQLAILGSLFVMLWNNEPTPHDGDNPGRVMLCAPVPANLHREFEERFGLRLVVAYGLSEATPVLMSSWDEPPPPGSSGKANPLFDVKLLDDEDAEVPPGQVGEIACRPLEPHVMFEGYYENPAATMRMWRNLWFHTGDLGRSDENGFVTFVDRKKDYLRRRGENISSFEVEQAIVAHPAVGEAAVHAVASEFSEDDVKACVILKDGAELAPRELLDHCVRNIPFFALPRYLEILDDFPRNPVGRVLKYVLRERGVTASTWDRETEGYEIPRRDRPPAGGPGSARR